MNPNTFWNFFLLSPQIFLECHAFVRPLQSSVQGRDSNIPRHATINEAKDEFLESLDRPYDLNTNNPNRTRLLQKLVESGKRPGGINLSTPGNAETFSTVAPGTWKVVYAPHMTIAAGLLGGEFQVQYDLKDDGTMTSHARYNFPVFNLWGYLSVSGTYGSVNDHVCRVDFDEAWYRPLENESFADGPYPTIDTVPESFSKNVIRRVGRALFIEPFAVFPVSYLDNEIIVFEFELFSTRICARKEY